MKVRCASGSSGGSAGGSFDMYGAKYGSSIVMTCCGSSDSTLVDSKTVESDSVSVTLKRAFKGKLTFIGCLRGGVSRAAILTIGSTPYNVEYISNNTQITEYDLDVASGTTITFTIGQCDYAYGATANFREC